MPFMTLGLVGATAGKPAFADQRRLVADLTTVADWNRSGLSVLVDAPRTLAYVFHHLHGACCMEVGNVGDAIQLARAPLPSRRTNEMTPLHTHRDISGSPESLPGSSTEAWEYLLRLPERHSVLNELFALQRDYENAITSYNLLLTLVELAADAGELVKHDELRHVFFDVPPMYIAMPAEVRQNALARVVRDREIVEKIVTSTGARLDDVHRVWPARAEATKKFAAKAYPDRMWFEDFDLGSLA